MRLGRQRVGRCVGDSSGIPSGGRRGGRGRWRCRECNMGALVAVEVDFGREDSDSIAVTSRAKSTSQTRKAAPPHCREPRAASALRHALYCIHRHLHVTAQCIDCYKHSSVSHEAQCLLILQLMYSSALGSILPTNVIASLSLPHHCLARGSLCM